MRDVPGHAPVRDALPAGGAAGRAGAGARHVAGHLDAPEADVRARWPSDAVEVSVEGQPRESGARLSVQVDLWEPASASTRAGIGEQAERLAARRRAQLAGVELTA